MEKLSEIILRNAPKKIQMIAPVQEPELTEQQVTAASLKAKLKATDYKVIKCSEYLMAGLSAPYDIITLNAERQAIRDEINRLENGNA